jgi:hypothetical protein
MMLFTTLPPATQIFCPDFKRVHNFAAALDFTFEPLNVSPNRLTRTAFTGRDEQYVFPSVSRHRAAPTLAMVTI